jgi:hypothetical protein
LSAFPHVVLYLALHLLFRPFLHPLLAFSGDNVSEHENSFSSYIPPAIRIYLNEYRLQTRKAIDRPMQQALFSGGVKGTFIPSRPDVIVVGIAYTLFTSNPLDLL